MDEPTWALSQNAGAMSTGNTRLHVRRAEHLREIGIFRRLARKAKVSTERDASFRPMELPRLSTGLRSARPLTPRTAAGCTVSSTITA